MTIKSILSKNKLTSAIQATCAIAILSTPLPSYSADGFAIEEVTVTARKREESLQDTPISVSAFTGDALELRQVDSSDRLGQITPNLTFDSNAPSSGHSSASQIYIRGIGQSEFLPTSEPGVGLYIDGVYIARSIGSVINFLDVERIEVLRGPQGTLFGRNTIGGAIVLHTKKPSDEFTGDVSVKLGSDKLNEFKINVSGPITDNLFGKLTAATKRKDGYVKRQFTGETLGDDDDMSIQGALLWQPNDEFELHISADYTREDEQGAPLVYGDNNTTAVFANAASAAAGCTDINDLTDSNCANSQFNAGPYVNSGTGPTSSELDVWGVAATAEWAVSDSLTFKSITSYRDMENVAARDADNTPLTILDTLNVDDQFQFSQEFQLIGSSLDDRMQWILGAYYFQEEDDNITVATVTHPAFGVIDLHLSGLVENGSTAVFGQVTYDLTDDLSVTAGLRWTDESREFTPDQFIAQSGAVLAPSHTVELNETEITPMISVSYQVTDEDMLYFTYSEGFKSGGFNARNTRPVPEVPVFGPEFAETFELGFKTSWLDNSLQVNGALFFTDYTDLQFTVRSDIAPVLFNAGAASIQGFELETTFVPNESWLITAALGYTDAEYDEVDPLANGVTADNELAQTPEWQGNIGVAYTVDLGGWVVTPRFDWSYTDSKYFNSANDPQLFQDSVDIVNAAISADSADEHWNITLGITNLTDEEYLVAGTSSYGTATGYVEHVWAREREYSIKVKYSW